MGQLQWWNSLMLLGNFEQKFFFTLWSVTIFTLVKQHNQSVVRFYLAYIVQSTFLPVPICDQYYLQVKCSCAHIVIRNISLQTEKVLGFTNKIKVSISGLTVKLCKNVLLDLKVRRNYVLLCKNALTFLMLTSKTQLYYWPNYVLQSARVL